MLDNFVIIGGLFIIIIVMLCSFYLFIYGINKKDNLTHATLYITVGSSLFILSSVLLFVIVFKLYTTIKNARMIYIEKIDV